MPTQRNKNQFKLGENVFGLWPGSGGLYFKATVVEVDADNGTYDVKFEEGTTYTLLDKHVKKMDTFKASEPRSSQRTSRRTTGRSSSVSRSRSRSRTPGRKPGRPKKQVSPQAPEKEKKIVAEEPVEVKQEVVDVKVEEKKVAIVDVVDDIPLSKRRSTKTEEPSENVSLSRRRSARLATKGDGAKLDSSVDSTDEAKPEVKKIDEMECDSTEDMKEVEVKSESDAPKLRTFSTLLGTLLLLSTTFSFYLICNLNQCSFAGLNLDSISLDQVTDFYNPIASLVVGVFLLATALFTIIPVGEKVNADSASPFYSNAMVTWFLVLSTCYASKHYFQLPAITILQHLPQSLLPTLVAGLLASLVIGYQTRDRRASAGTLGHVIHGCSESSVSLGRLNVKIFLHRFVCLSLLMLNSLAIEADYKEKRVFSPTLALCAALQIIYSLESLLNERTTFVNSFEFNHVKVGLSMISGSICYPFLTFLSTLSLLNYRIELPYYCLLPIAVLFLEGLWVKMGSSRQRAEFIENPEDSSFANMESLSSSSGEKLLISGWWGWIRNPNYLGDIVMHLTFALPSGLYVLMPYILAMGMTVHLVRRTGDNDQARKVKYGPSWERYCQRVPSRVVPHLY